MAGEIALLTLVPKPEFMALDEAGRRAFLLPIAARLQEWTGPDGGAFFCKKIEITDGAAVVFGFMSRSADLSQAMIRELDNAELRRFFDLTIIAGPDLRLESAELDHVKQQLEATFQPFLDL